MKLCLLALAPLSLLASSVLHAQASYTAIKTAKYQLGVGYLFLDDDNTGRKAGGITAYGDFDFSRFLGVEAEAHFGALQSPDDIGENTYYIGPRAYYRWRKTTIYGKLSFGRTGISNLKEQTSHTYNSYSFGGGIEYRLSRHINLRPFEVIEQKCPDYEPHTLSPLAATFGLAYAF